MCTALGACTVSLACAVALLGVGVYAVALRLCRHTMPDCVRKRPVGVALQGVADSRFFAYEVAETELRPGPEAEEPAWACPAHGRGVPSIPWAERIGGGGLKTHDVAAAGQGCPPLFCRRACGLAMSPLLGDLLDASRVQGLSNRRRLCGLAASTTRKHDLIEALLLQALSPEKHTAVLTQLSRNIA